MATKELPIAPLEPINARACQCERQEGSFMTFGNPTTRVCGEPVSFFAVENKVSDRDGLRGAMALCEHHASVMVGRLGDDFATLYRVEQ